MMVRLMINTLCIEKDDVGERSPNPSPLYCLGLIRHIQVLQVRQLLRYLHRVYEPRNDPYLRLGLIVDVTKSFQR